MEFVVSRSPLSYCEDAAKVELMDDPMELPKEVLEGTNPVVSSEMLSVGMSDGGLVVARGLMRCTPGKYKDLVDDDEFFTIIHGRATVEVLANSQNNISACVLELVEGSVGELRKGSELIYTVHETILKSFQLSMSASDEEESKSIETIKAEQDFASSNYSVLSSSVDFMQPELMEEGTSWINSDPAPEVTSALLSSMDGGHLVRGLWRCTAGSCTYVEQDELFTVLSGAARVTVRRRSGGTDKSAVGAKSSSNNATCDDTEGVGGGGEERILLLSKGMVGEFKAGDVATFEVEGEEPFLKSFQITEGGGGTANGNY